jgi:hypothetical protein
METLSAARRSAHPQRQRALAIAVFWVLGVAAAPAAWGQAADDAESDWDFVIAPYIWLPAMTGDATVKGRTTEIDTTVSDLFTETDFVFALSAEMEAWYRNTWGLAVNGQWTILEQDDHLEGTPLQFDLKNNLGLFEVLGFYSYGERPLGSSSTGTTWSIQPLIGVRVTTIRTNLDFKNAGSFDAAETWADPILGSRSIIRFGKDQRLSGILRGDFGGFGLGSTFTWNLVGMLGYDFAIRSVDMTALFGMRALSQDFTDGSGSDRFKWDVIQYGPLVGLAFRF